MTNHKACIQKDHSAKPTKDWSNIGELNVRRRILRPCPSHVTAVSKRTHPPTQCTHTTHTHTHTPTHTHNAQTHTHARQCPYRLSASCPVATYLYFLSKKSYFSLLKPIHLTLVPSLPKTPFRFFPNHHLHFQSFSAS